MIEFKKGNPDVNKQEWKLWKNRVLVSCPLCGQHTSLDHDVAVDVDGAVFPSIVCPFPPCRFHDFGQLMDWETPAEPIFRQSKVK